MPTPEQILTGPGRQEDKKKTPSKKGRQGAKAEHVDAHDAVDAFPVKPRPWMRTIRHALDAHGRSAEVPIGYSLHHGFKGSGRPIDGVLYSVP